MGTERDNDRYAPLDETQRKLREEDENRRSAEAEQIAARVRAGHYEPLRDTHHRVAEEELSRAVGREPSAGKPEREPYNELDDIEARTAAREKELDEKVRLGRITSGDKVHEMRQFDSELLVEMNTRDERRGRDEEASRSQQQDRGGNEPSEARSQTAQDSASQEHEVADREEKSDVRAARKARLRGFDREIERETRENEGKGLDRDRDSGNRSR